MASACSSMRAMRIPCATCVVFSTSLPLSVPFRPSLVPPSSSSFPPFLSVVFPSSSSGTDPPLSFSSSQSRGNLDLREGKDCCTKIEGRREYGGVAGEGKRESLGDKLLELGSVAKVCLDQTRSRVELSEEEGKLGEDGREKGMQRTELFSELPPSVTLMMVGMAEMEKGGLRKALSGVFHLQHRSTGQSRATQGRRGRKRTLACFRQRPASSSSPGQFARPPSGHRHSPGTKDDRSVRRGRKRRRGSGARRGKSRTGSGRG
jgi:hypothetical protein